MKSVKVQMEKSPIGSACGNIKDFLMFGQEAVEPSRAVHGFTWRKEL